MVDATNLFHTILFAFTRYPCYNDITIEKILQKYSANKQDIEQLRFFSYSKWKLWHTVLISIAISFWLFHSSVATYLLIATNYNNPNENLEHIANGKVKFWCIYTNCSRFIEQSDPIKSTSLAQDLLQIPYFSLCHPKIRQISYPSVDSGINGCLLILLISCGTFNYAIVSQIVQFLRPSGDDTILFIAAPDLATKIMRYTMRKSYVDLLASMFVYKTNRIKYTMERRLLRLRDHFGVIRGSNFRGLNDNTTKNQIEFENLIKAHYNHGQSDQVDEFIDDCIPLFRTNWWRNRVVHSYKYYLIYVMAPCLFSVFTGLLVFIDGIITRNALYQRIAIHLDKQNCSIWTNNAKDDNNIVDHSRVDTILNFHTISVTVGPAIIIQHLYTSFVSLYSLNPKTLAAYISQSELMSLIREIESQLFVVNELANIQFNIKDYRSIGSSTSNLKMDTIISTCCSTLPSPFKSIKQQQQQQNPAKFKLCQIQNLLKQKHSNDKFIGPTGQSLRIENGPYKSNDTNDLVFNQRLAFEIYENEQDCLRTLIDLLEKLYIKMKFYLILRANYGRSLTLLLFYFALGSYINAYVVLILMRHLPDKRFLVGFVGVCFSYFAITLLATSSLNNYVSDP